MSQEQENVDAATVAPVVESTKPIHESFREAALAEVGGVQPVAETAAEPVAAPVPVVAPKSRVVAEYLKSQYEADLGDVSDEDLAPQIGHILETNQVLEQRLAERERQLSEYLAAQKEFEEFRSSKAQAKEVASREQKPPEPKVKALQYDADWEHLATLDKDTGLWSPKAKFGLQAIEAADKLNQYAREQADRARRLVADPLSLMLDAGLDIELNKIRDELRREIEEKVNSLPTRLKQEQVAKQVESQVQTWIQERSSDLFATDTQGRVLYRAGDPVLTEKGVAYQRAAIEARDVFGITDPYRVHAYASKQYEYQYPVLAATPAPVEQPAPVAPTPQEKNAELKRKFLEKGHQPASVPTNRDGAYLAAAKDGRSGNSFLHRFREQVLSDPDNADLLGANFKG